MPRAQSLLNRIVIAAAPADVHHNRVECPRHLLDEDDLALAGIDHGAFRHGQTHAALPHRQTNPGFEKRGRASRENPKGSSGMPNQVVSIL